MNLKKIIAERVKMHRAVSGIGQKELSKKCGVAQSTIAQIESGRKSPSVETLGRIAKGLGVEPALLLTKGRLEIK